MEEDETAGEIVESNAGYWPVEIQRDWVWIRLLGLPLNLCSENFFRQSEEICEGFFETEEETSLKNHLHWARIKVRGDGKEVPREIKLKSDGYIHAIPVWVEALVAVRVAEERRDMGNLCIVCNRYPEPILVKSQHVSSLKDGVNSNFKPHGNS